tara:strand:- start:44367 stop:44894 length:528 start_codon:yes stop_codon:yes gene_type:complete
MEKTLFKSKISLLENLKYIIFFGLIIYLLVNSKPTFFKIINNFGNQFFNYSLDQKTFDYAINGIIIFVSFFIIYRIVYTITKKYEFNENRLIMKEGVFIRKTDYIELFRIKDIEIVEPLLLRLFRSCNVVFYTTDKSHPKLKLTYLKNFKNNELVLRNQIDKIIRSGRGREVDVA